VIDGHREVELGFRIGRDHRGRGYAFEAARAVLADGFARLDLASIVAYAEPGNAPSLKLLEKLGMPFERETDHHGRRYRIHRLDNPNRQA
jgi:RimJ/RimL family protein N-acetyltransferase